MSPKASPLLGYNNNVRHRGKVFHIQTEDSGVRYGHIITHLFMDGGRILKSVKTSYAEYVESDRRTEIVREMMKQQHKAMFIALRDGKFDGVVDGSAQTSQSTRAVAAEAPARMAASRTPTAARVERVAPEAVAPTARGPVRPPSSGSLPIDVHVLERAAAAASEPQPALRSTTDLPPPPSNLLREKTAAGPYRVTPGATEGPANVSARARPDSPRGPATSPERRYAPTRPSSTFGQARPQQGKTIFGEDPPNDKSLDEVILTYLSTELDDKE
jgi:hypothetical protein